MYVKRPPEEAAIEDRIAALATASMPTFELCLPDRPSRVIGDGDPSFSVVALDGAGVQALESLDELRIGEAYIDGHLDIRGDIVAALQLRPLLRDSHVVANLWSMFGSALVSRRVVRDRSTVKKHYEADPEFWLCFLDEDVHGYSHGFFDNDEEALEPAMVRKLDYAIEACRLGPGSRVLDVGAGWGAFVAHAGRRGIEVTALTISPESRRFVAGIIERENLPCSVIEEHLFEHQGRGLYDAIVVLGVTEHLPHYTATLREFQRLLKPGGRVYLDSAASRRKHTMSSFARTLVWPGKGTFLHVSSYLRAVEHSAFDVIEVRSDRHNYALTTRRWAENLDKNRATVVERWGERTYRLFRLYLWGSSLALARGTIEAYRIVLELPSPVPRRREMWRLTAVRGLRSIRSRD
ncbi:MAG: cyclopropane-fatty-acyl-phospholipid synthase [Actinomycetota bacterium]|nr:cyclopropane-fatty-acyl-phospholipid synthase [Actinomycetota bacterium]